MSKAIAEVFADAKHAPTSFEPEDWIGGFQFARAAIAERGAYSLRAYNLGQRDFR